MYDDILEEQALLWEMTKEAAEADMTPARYYDYTKGQFENVAEDGLKNLTNRQKMQIARGRFGREDGTNKRVSRSDRDISRLQQLRAMAGRASGYYDLSTARNLSKQLRDARSGMTEQQLKEFDKIYGKGGAKEFKALSKSQQRAMVRDAIANQKIDVSKLRGAQLEAFKRGKKGLYIRGGGKAALGLTGLGALGYGGYQMSKKSSYDPVVELVEDLDGWEFAKEAELRAAEILLENGIDPETFEPTYPEHVKLASFPEPGDAMTYEGDEELIEYNEMLDDAAYAILEELGF